MDAFLTRTAAPGLEALTLVSAESILGAKTDADAVIAWTWQGLRGRGYPLSVPPGRFT